MTGQHGDAVRGIRPGSGEVALLFSAAVYGVSTTVSVVALRVVRPADLLAVEISGAAVTLLIAAAARGQLARHGALRQMLLGALVPGSAFLFGDLGLARTSAASGSLLLAAEPLLSVLLALAVLRERLPGRAAVALVAGLAGGALVALDPGGPPATGATAVTSTTLGNVLVLLAVVAAAVFLVATRRLNDAGDGLAASAWQSLGGALAVLPFVTVSWSTGGTRLDTAGVAGWSACLAVVVCGVLGGVAFNRGIARVPAARAAQLGNLTPVIGTLTAIAFLGDRPSASQLIGGVAILAGLALLLHPPAPSGPSDRTVAGTDPDAGRTSPRPIRPVPEPVPEEFR